MGKRSLPWYWFGLANLVVVCGLSLGFWYLLIDPNFHVLGHTYPEPFDEVLFWMILVVVFLGFNLEFHWFDRLPQPVRGLTLIGATLGLAIGITALLAGWGHFDPAFSDRLPKGNGYFIGALFVLFGFYTYLTIVINWDHWPWRQKGLTQPWLGIAEILVTTTATVVAYVLFVFPDLETWAKPTHNVLVIPTLIGIVYSIIIVSLITGLLTENWPWRLAGGGGRTAAASLVGTVAFGIGIYFLFRVIVNAIFGHTYDLLAPNTNQYPAELGVCWSFWMIFWSNACDNRPTGFSMAVNYIVRILVTFGLAVGTFIVYSYVLAPHILHEPVVAGHVYGNALGWMDWMILWILLYVVYLGSWGVPGLPEVSADEPEAMERLLEEHEAPAAGPATSDGAAAGRPVGGSEPATRRE